MNILHITSGTVPIHSDGGGGVERHVRSITTEIEAAGHDVTIVDNDYGDSGPTSINGVNVKRFRTPRVSTGFLDGWGDTLANEILFAARLGRIRHLVDESDIVHAHNVYVGTRAHRLARNTGTAFAYTCHNGMWCADDVNAYERHVVRRLEGRLLAQANLPIAVSDAVADGVESVTRPRPEVIPNGVDIEQFRPGVDTATVREEYSLNDARVVLFVGRISEAKGVDVLVRAVRSVVETVDDPVRFVFVGPNVQMFGSATESEYGNRIRRLIESEGVEDSLVLTGRVSEESLQGLYAAADVFTLPSRFEAQPMVVVEALASGTPVVGTTAGGIPEVVTDDVGRVVPADDPTALADALSELLSLDAPAHKTIRQAARRRAEDEYAWSTIAQRLLSKYEEVV